MEFHLVHAKKIIYLEKCKYLCTWALIQEEGEHLPCFTTRCLRPQDGAAITFRAFTVEEDFETLEGACLGKRGVSAISF